MVSLQETKRSAERAADNTLSTFLLPDHGFAPDSFGSLSNPLDSQSLRNPHKAICLLEAAARLMYRTRRLPLEADLRGATSL